ncbi:cytochrome P450 [Dankookia sp. P2]|uniref:cytochrome P450 n=1 Tax=Dankookia sp. P2 TaxID=3423955 RepID=UPI003D67C432
MNAPVSHDPHADAWATPLDQLDPGNPARFQDDTMWPVFARLRRDAPVHYSTTSPMFGPYWSVTRYKDIMAVEVNHKAFSSDSGFGGISIRDRPKELQLPMFIAMDPPRHDDQRKVVQPIVAPANLAKLEGIIRDRVCTILEGLPRNETFNWVEHVSIELTVTMLATLFDFPYEDRRKLSFWSDCATAAPEAGGYIDSEAKREEVFAECLAYFTSLWNERVNVEPRPDLVSMLAHGEATRNMTPREYLGNLILLIVGGNDTTRNSISGGVLFLHQNPGEFAKLRANPGLIETMVPEIIRYQTPMAHMRRTCVQDTELSGQRIKAGDKVVMWYISGNRDPEAIEEPERFIIDRKRPRQHLSFGFGIHRCVGNRLAELQLKILWEEILKRFERIEVVGEPKRVFSSFVHGITDLPVRIPA